ncbi:two-component regulator propeller domain-containing protein [Faecalimicrobium sp. JNUCC 81]
MKKISLINILTINILSFIFFVMSFFNVNAYAHDIKFRNITHEDGLSQATVETIIQDRQGYIWIGTNDGLNKYNGYDFKIYRHDQDSENSITNNYIVDLQEDKEGNIWVGTANGLNKINHQGKITNYFAEKDNGNLSNNNIGDILITKAGDVMVATSNGLNVYDEEKNEFKRILSGENDITNQFIHTLKQDANGDIWIGTKNGLNKLDIKSQKIYKFYSNETENSISGNNIYGLSYDDDGYIWIGTFKEGLNRIDINTHEIKRYKNDPKDINSLPGNYVKDVYKDSNNILWVATDRGLAKYNEKKDNFTTYKNKIYDEDSLVDDDLFTIIEDKSGLIWVGTYNGVSVFDSNNKMEHYKKDPTNKNSLSDNLIHGIYEDKDGLLWVGTNSKGVNVIDRRSDKVTHINKDSTNGIFVNDSINDITGKDNIIYIGTNNGLVKIDKDKNIIDTYDKSNGICEDNVRCLYLDSKGYLWIGTTDGVSILNTKNDEVIDITKILKDNGIEDLFARVIYEDKEGIYWIGSFVDGGLIRLDPVKKTIKNYKRKTNDKRTISSDTVRSIAEDNKGNLWIGTSYGLNKFNKKSETFTRYTVHDGLSNDTVYGILVDNDDDLWLSTNEGISKLDTESNKFEKFGATDGLQGNEFNGSAYYENSKGEFFFGGTNGLNIFNPDKVKKNDYVPNVVFDGFEVNGKSYNNIDGLKFKHNENFININMFISDYRNIENVQYKYMLEGADSEWHMLDRNNINYSNLPPGNYTLKVKARSHNGKVTDENHVSFTILPHPLKSDIAIFIYFLLFILIIYSYINRMKYLDKLVTKKTEQLSYEMEKSNELLNKVIQLERNKNNYFINLSHELRTPLNVIYTTEQLITEFNKSEKGIEKDKLSDYMKVMNRNIKRLLNLINNLIDTTKIDNGKYKINLKEENIVYIVEEATLSLKEYIESKGIQLIIDPDIEEKNIKCDAYEIERCIVNLVGNAAKFTPSGGTIEVRIKELNNRVIITIEDNGIGIDPKYHKLIFDRFNQIVDANSEVKGGSGLGLTITKHIIEMHNGEIYVEGNIGKGAKFTIIL